MIENSNTIRPWDTTLATRCCYGQTGGPSSPTQAPLVVHLSYVCSAHVHTKQNILILSGLRLFHTGTVVRCVGVAVNGVVRWVCVCVCVCVCLCPHMHTSHTHTHTRTAHNHTSHARTHSTQAHITHAHTHTSHAHTLHTSHARTHTYCAPCDVCPNCHTGCVTHCVSSHDNGRCVLTFCVSRTPTPPHSAVTHQVRKSPGVRGIRETPLSLRSGSPWLRLGLCPSHLTGNFR